MSLTEGEFGRKYLPNEYYSAGCVSRVLRTLATIWVPKWCKEGWYCRSTSGWFRFGKLGTCLPQEQEVKVDISMRLLKVAVFLSVFLFTTLSSYSFSFSRYALNRLAIRKSALSD